MKKIIVALFLLFCCVTTFAQLNAEQKSIKKVFANFLNFYQKNEKKFDAFKLFKGKADNGFGPPYYIQWKEVGKYFTFLRTQVPYVGEAYITNERKHFTTLDSIYKAYPTEEIAEGFDYDRWAGGQESVKYMVKWHLNPKNKIQVIITGNTAILRIGTSINNEVSWSEVPFVKEKGKWVMADNIQPAD
jgi:hypothetical protein